MTDEFPQLVGSNGLISITRTEAAIRIARAVRKGAVRLRRSMGAAVEAYGAALATAWTVQFEIMQARRPDRRDGIEHRFDRRL